MKEYLPIIGLGFILYGGSRLFHYLGMVFKESFGIIFLGLSFLLGLCSFPVSIVMYGIEHLHEEHMSKIVEQNTRAERRQWYEELRQTDQKIYYDKGYNDAKNNYQEILDIRSEREYKKGHDAAIQEQNLIPAHSIQAFQKGFHEGYIEGYRDAQLDSQNGIDRLKEMDL